MLTYTFSKSGAVSLYEQLYRAIKEDILAGRLTAGEKLPSKRTLSAHLEISVITVKTAYEQLVAEGYLYAVEKKGYYVAAVEKPLQTVSPVREKEEGPERQWRMDFGANTVSEGDFPFSVWTRLMRQTILEQDTALLRPTPPNGALALRQAICDNLRQFRGMAVSPGQVIVGAGTEVLYNMLVQLLGRDKCYAVEDPGYSKIARIYEGNQVKLRRIGLDDKGLDVGRLRRTEADVVHISPSHHYPTGIVMPIGRRQELLRWAGEKPGRYILEDDYDSEFRFVGRPIPTLFSVDENRRVIYLNTFSKTIAPSIRISYMVLPPELVETFRQKLGFYTCTVSGFEQYTLAQFMARGHYEQHLNRMRKRYHQKRDAVIDIIRRSGLPAKITEQDAGLHFLMTLQTELPDEALRQKAAEKDLRLAFLSDYYGDRRQTPSHVLVVNYSGIDLKELPSALTYLRCIMEEKICTMN